MALFRVAFDGPAQYGRQPDAASTAIEWEGSTGLGHPDQRRHYFLVLAEDASEAKAVVYAACKGAVDSTRLTADEVVPPRTWHGLGAGINWESIAARQRLSQVQRRVIETLLDAPEPTWMIVREAAVGADSREVEDALVQLEELGLVKHEIWHSGQPRTEEKLEKWWALTLQGWDFLGLIQRPWYGQPK